MGSGTPPRILRVRLPGAERLAEGEARKVIVPLPGRGPVELLLTRLEGRLFALDSLCPHEGGRLAEGPLWDGCHVYCPLHLYRFDPRTGASIEIECEPARTYVLRETAEGVEVEFPEDAPDAS